MNERVIATLRALGKYLIRRSESGFTLRIKALAFISQPAGSGQHFSGIKGPPREMPLS